MRSLVFIWLGCAVLWLTACGEKPGDSQSGIEIGNPSVGLSAQFVLDYGEPEYNTLQGLLKLPGDDETMLVEDFRLGLSEVRHFSSYYIHMPTDPLIGLRIWPRTSVVDTLIYLSFDASGSSVMSFADWNLPAKSFLKEVALVLPTAGLDSGVIGGKLRIQNVYRDFEYQLPAKEALQLRYHVNQIENHLEDSVLHLPVRFHVPAWIKGIDFSTAQEDPDGVIRFHETSNPEIWQRLSERFAASFNSLRYARVDSSGTMNWEYPLNILAQFDTVGHNWVRDGHFRELGRSWILVQQFDGAAKTRHTADSLLEIDIVQGGYEVFSIQLIQENIPLLAGKKYRISFQASSNMGSEIVVRIGLYHSPYSGVSPDFTFGLYDGLGAYAREFTATTTNLFGRLEFNLGGQVRKLVIGNVQVTQLD